MKLNPLYWLKINKIDEGDGDAGGGGGSMLPAGEGPGEGAIEAARTDDKGIAYDKDDKVIHYGDAERPWFRKDKYENTDDQAKAYNDAAKMVGEKSELQGAPEGDYELTMPEGVEGEFIADDPLMASFTEVAKEMNLSQESFDKILHAYLSGESGAMQTNVETEIKALGENADRRLQDLSDFGIANLDQTTYDAFRNVATTAAGVQVLEAMMGLTKDHKIPDGNNLELGNSGETPSSLKEMRAKQDDHGNLLMSMDPAYKKKVDKAYNDYYGSAPKTTTVGG